MPRAIIPVHVTVDYYWVPNRVEQYTVPRVAIRTEPKRVQTCYFHTDHEVKPDIPNPQHRVNVFYEDHVHDWNWKNGELHYASRVMDGGVWIRCEFEAPRYQVYTAGVPGHAYYFKTLAAAKADVTRRGRKYRSFGLRASDRMTDEVWAFDASQNKIVQVLP